MHSFNPDLLRVHYVSGTLLGTGGHQGTKQIPLHAKPEFWRHAWTPSGEHGGWEAVSAGEKGGAAGKVQEEGAGWGSCRRG